MKGIRHIYRTSTLSEYGKFILTAFILLLIAGYFTIPEYPVQGTDRQLIKIRGKHFRFNDHPHLSEFLLSVKKNDGFICMGTSESTPLRDGNYYEFLDQDTSYPNRFSILGGAGWTCGIHMAMLLNHKAEVDSLQLIYFINPVYWRSDLKGFRKSYWTRYLNYGTWLNTLEKAQEYPEFEKISSAYREKLNPAERFLFRLEYWLRMIRKPFFRDLRYALFPEEYRDDLQFFAEPKIGVGSFDFLGRIDTSYLDTDWNITHEFMGRTWLNPLEKNEYRDHELRAFIHLCNALNVDVCFVLGPVNEIFISKYHPSYLDAYVDGVKHIRAILLEEKADFVDAAHLGNIPGSFIDNQHHSSYGAYLIYQLIKQHLYEKGDL
ncbi:MAG: D-alanyl-lipoteichoic acid biosynthesis protein DltD [Bacteroidales bacterium]|nr:D-alanyl-lipoteichoic acid biosynthesis protein DltD [Bacteroidales bacterium]